MPLNVSAPFHCALMRPAAETMARALAEITIAPPTVPIVANVAASAVSAPAQIREHLVAQVTGTVRWRECIGYMAEEGVREIYEIGSGKVLAGLAKRIARDIDAVSIGTPAEIDAALPKLI
jgi:[acyl-carrier-protein] S-malonyltransferase